MGKDGILNDVDAFLAHYGKKGMKWGVVNDNDSSSSSKGGEGSSKKSKKAVTPEEQAKRETKAKSYEVKAAKYHKETANLEKQLAQTPKGTLKSNGLLNQIAESNRLAKIAEKDAAAAREGRMSTGQKQALIGAAVVGGILLAYGGKHMVQSGQFTSMATQGKAFMDGNSDGLFGKKKNNSKLSDPNYSADDIMRNVVPGVNPNYGAWGTNMNCRRATFAYEMRRRGYDVQATRTSNASGQTVFGVMNATSRGKLSFSEKIDKAGKEYSNGLGRSVIHSNTPEVIFRTLSAQPERSRGEFAVSWKSAVPGIPGGGHSMAYEVINGKAHIFDTQTGKEYKDGDPVFKQVSDASFTRLDNAPMNEKFLSKWVR